MYNEIIEEVCKDFGVPFIDTRNITGLMWERAEDWCHYRDISGKMEALYFLQKLNVYYNSTMLYNADLSKLDERSWNP